MRCVIILADGLADAPQGVLAGHTPLEMAVTPVLDDIARSGRVGSVAPLEGSASGSLPAILALLGYPINARLLARAAFEAAGLGLKLGPGESAWRLQFVTMADDKIADPAPANLSPQETAELLGALDEKLSSRGWRFHEGTGHNHLALTRVDMSDVQTVSPWDARNKELNAVLPRGRNAGPLVQLIETAQTVLNGHEVNKIRIDLKQNPANAAWPWGGGIQAKLTPFQEVHSVSAAMATASPLARGVALSADMRVLESGGFSLALKDPSGRFATTPAKKPIIAPAQGTTVLAEEFGALAAAAIGALATDPVVFVHTSAVADAALGGGPIAKRTAIEALDTHLIAPLVRALTGKDDIRLAVVSTVGIDSGAARHIAAPSPFCVWGAGVSAREHKTLTEKNVETAGMKVSAPQQFVEYVLGGL